MAFRPGWLQNRAMDSSIREGTGMSVRGFVTGAMSIARKAEFKNVEKKT